MLELETRPFEARFGGRCPFCNKSWGDPSPCGDSRADRTIRDSLGLLFADRKSKNCDICDRYIPGNRKFCWDCSAARENARQKARAGEDRHARVVSICQWCNSRFDHRSDKKPRFCSLSCANKNRHAQRRAA